MTHLFVCREFPPAPHPPGGIGTYVERIARLLAESGDTVHVIAHRWEGAAAGRESRRGGRLMIHRVALDDEVAGATAPDAGERAIRVGLLASSCPAQTFAWQAARLAEHLVDAEGIDVIEAQEWEAPLYYFLLRRRLGLASAKSRPPCIVHLHSPTARIFAANAWDTHVSDYAPMVAMEAFTIRSADALLCPSRYVADQVADDYGVPRERITVIPYPLGDVAPVTRSAEVWTSGSICHVGRVEGRKGLAEWAEAVAVAGDRSVWVELAGGDTPVSVTGGRTVGRAIRQALTPAWKRRFRFLGTLDRRGVRETLGRAWAAVVPSRWENFPYSSIEAMASGLPVIASPDGGMRELVDDGVSGWIAKDGSPRGLAEALTRALATSPAQRAAMGAAAAERVGALCGEQTVREQHLALKRWLGHAAAPRRATISAAAGTIAVIIVDRAGGDLSGVRRGLAAQSVGLASVTVVSRHPTAATRSLCSSSAWRLVVAGEPAAQFATIIETIRAAAPAVAAIAIVDAHLVLLPSFAANMAALFHSEPDLGVASGWLTDFARDHVTVPDDPSSPHIGDHGTTSLYLVAGARSWQRTVDRLGRAASFEAVLRSMAEHDGTVTWPAVLCEAPTTLVHRHSARRYSAMARAIQRPHVPLVKWFFDATPEDRRAMLARAFRDPKQLARQLAGSFTQSRPPAGRSSGQR